ncbi:MAG: FAD-dependent oxidoreductase, partial [Saprospiraceae bacterium]|nr:FAD-dependent oxidoreductase [Saprospiraceae bacterium]
MDVVIIGNGISGITAAKWIRKLSDHNIKVISSESEHFFSRTALMYVYMGHMRFEDIKPYEDWFWDKNRIELNYDHVNTVDPSNKTLSLKEGGKLSYDKLIIATGSRSNKFGWPGQDLKGVNGLYHLQDMEAMESYSKDLDRAVIVGGGLIGIEMAEMFHSRNIPVTML